MTVPDNDSGAAPAVTGRPADPTPDAPSPSGRFLTRSEEHVDISTHAAPARRVRLEKFVVTETRTLTVQVRREEARLVEVDNAAVDSADLDDAEVAQAFAGRADGDVGRWLTLHEERVVIATEVVPVERVRLSIDTVVEQREIPVEKRSERIDLETVAFSDADSGPAAADR